MSAFLSSLEDHLMTDEYLADPYPTLARLREEAPVYFCRRWNAWLVTRYAEATEILKDFKRFSNQERITKFLSRLRPEELEQLGYLVEHYRKGGLVQSDPPDHTRLRRLLQQGFNAKAVARMSAFVVETVNELIGKIDGDEFDLVEDFAFPLPANVIAAVLGVPHADRDMFKVWSSSIQRFIGSGTVRFDYALEAQESWRRMNSYFAGLLAQRRRKPEDDMISTLAEARDEGERLTEDELIRTCGAMLIAGHETTTNLIANGVRLLLGNPGLKETMQGATEEEWSGLVEEFLRLESPFQAIPRTVVGNTAVGGQELRQGDLVWMMLGAANRDPSVFADPDAVDLNRANKRHIAFGSGIHLCLGAALARLEAPIAIRALFKAMPALALHPTKKPVWKDNMGQRGMESFPLVRGA